MKKNVYILALVFALTLAWSGLASAHAAIVWAYVENGKVNVEAFFATGGKIQNAQVAVVDAKGELMLKGKTDKEGKFSYKPVTKETQTVVVSAGDSHMGDFELTAEDLAEIP